MSKNIEHRNSKGQLHNTNGPAWISFYKNGRKMKEIYCIEGNLHNTNGPARIYWYSNGQKESEEYWIDGNELTRKEFLKLREEDHINDILRNLSLALLCVILFLGTCIVVMSVCSAEKRKARLAVEAEEQGKCEAICAPYEVLECDNGKRAMCSEREWVLPANSAQSK